MKTIEKLTLILLMVVFGGCKDKESEPVEPNVQSTQNITQEEILPTPEEPTPPSLTLNLRYSGRPIKEFTSVAPFFSLNNRDTGKQGIVPIIKYNDGNYEIEELKPGNYVLFVSINANPNNPGNYPGYPGDFFYRDTNLVIPPDGGISRNVDFQKIIHLILPQDNDGIMDKWGTEWQDKPTFTSPIEFAWDSIDEGAVYEYRISRMQAEPFTRIESDFIRETTSETKVSLDFVPSADNEYYLFTITAKKESKTIGGFKSHGENGYGADFRFRVK